MTDDGHISEDDLERFDLGMVTLRTGLPSASPVSEPTRNVPGSISTNFIPIELVT
jgi:hypothetical protein